MEGPPPGVDLAATQVPRILGVNISTYALAVIAVGLRFVSRKCTRVPLWWDDWLMLPALAFSGTMCFVSITWMVQHGLGKHIWVAPPDAAIVWAKGLFISEICYTGIICTIKFSLLCFYWRIFKQSNIRIPIYVLGAIVSCWGIAVILITIFQCIPVSGFWERFDPTSTAPKCGVNVNKFFNGNSIPNIITDGAILTLPMPFIWQLHLPRAQKVALSSIFILGAFVVGVSITRFTFILKLNLASPDITWNFVNTQIWTGVESHIGILCACLPSLRPILTYIMTGSLNTVGRSGGSNNLKGSGRGRGSQPRAWRPHLGTRETMNSANSNSAVKAEDDQNHLFKRISEAEQASYSSVEVATPTKFDGNIELMELNNDKNINVRTDVHIQRQLASHK